ncbi:MAG: hypothetical protein EOM20_05705 [Spartobacteria bacterium]|nr:hypothetical protein [Spartobacteria bacterium]
MQDKNRQNSGSGKAPGGLGNSVLIARPVNEPSKVNWLGVGVVILMVCALLIFVYGLFYRLAKERMTVEAVVSAPAESFGVSVKTPFPASEEMAADAALEVIEDTALPTAPVVSPAPPSVAIKDTFVIPKPAVIIDKDEYVVGLEEKLRVMASRLNELQGNYDMLRQSLANAETRNGELLAEREMLRSRVATLEKQLEDATLILEEIANY